MNSESKKAIGAVNGNAFVQNPVAYDLIMIIACSFNYNTALILHSFLWFQFNHLQLPLKLRRLSLSSHFNKICTSNSKSFWQVHWTQSFCSIDVPYRKCNQPTLGHLKCLVVHLFCQTREEENLYSCWTNRSNINLSPIFFSFY